MLFDSGGVCIARRMASRSLGLGLRDNECAPDCQEPLDGKYIEWMKHVLRRTECRRCFGSV